MRATALLVLVVLFTSCALSFTASPPRSPEPAQRSRAAVFRMATPRYVAPTTLEEPPAWRRVDRGRATIFAMPGDPWDGGVSRCLGRQVRESDAVIAHRTLPCGTPVRVTNARTGLVTDAIVGDRGPYGACLDDGWRRGPCESWAIKRRRSDPGAWRGVADLTPTVAAELGHRSFDVVTIAVVEAP